VSSWGFLRLEIPVGLESHMGLSHPWDPKLRVPSSPEGEKVLPGTAFHGPRKDLDARLPSKGRYVRYKKHRAFVLHLATAYIITLRTRGGR